eukprot:CAMPEP_0117650134 /NCGR_PEP_ID=MMETSP0804-20121206/1376_1 /TAXON_ID=1074897 /ORGANISM="Tetraselmis astigmatica, Strain CCMP880" /LENGTH=327 /DNA_ID=CAMNT_0005455983 /DNA_START=202 /DNA_END=1185 /DNA_ORIENTATION=-
MSASLPGCLSCMCGAFPIVAWHFSTGGTVAGRNMDGENDVRKLTVNLLLLHAVAPAEPGLLTHAHLLWPGFLGASSGLNEKGLYVMENAGCSPAGPPPSRTTVLRDVLSSALLHLSGGATPAQAKVLISGLASSSGGALPGGGILVFATPTTTAANGSALHGFVYEGDRYGGAMRQPAAVPPRAEAGVMASNHYLTYRADPLRPGRCDGIKAGFSSLWRYEAGKNRVEAWLRATARSGGGAAVGVLRMRELLRTVAQGTTEHSVIVLLDRMSLLVAVADVNGAWDAPFREWKEFSFHELFENRHQQQGSPNEDGRTARTAASVVAVQ